MTSTNSVITLLILVVICVAPSLSKAQDNNDSTLAQAQEQYKMAQEYYSKKDYALAEASCREANRLYESMRDASRPIAWHLFLSRILLKLNKNEDAWREVVSGWRNGWIERQDVMVGITSSRVDTLKLSAHSASYVVAQYLKNRSEVINLRLGSTKSTLPAYESSEGVAGAICWLLYGSDASVEPEEALECYAEAEQLYPDLPQTAFLQAAAYSMMSQKEKSKQCLLRAQLKARGSLKTMVDQMLSMENDKDILLLRANRYLLEAKALCKTEEYQQHSAIVACEKAIKMIEKVEGDSSKAKEYLAYLKSIQQK